MDNIDNISIQGTQNRAVYYMYFLHKHFFIFLNICIFNGEKCSALHCFDNFKLWWDHLRAYVKYKYNINMKPLTISTGLWIQKECKLDLMHSYGLKHLLKLMSTTLKCNYWISGSNFQYYCNIIYCVSFVCFQGSYFIKRYILTQLIWQSLQPFQF